VDKLKEIREKNNYTHKEMANLLGISKPYYWQIENNKRGLSYQMAFNISNIFNLRPDEIFYKEFEKQQNKE